MLLHHQTDRLLALSPEPPFRVSWNERQALMSLAHAGYVFSVRRAGCGPLTPCTTDEHVDLGPAGLVERAVTHGGYSARVRDIEEPERACLYRDEDGTARG